MRAGREIHQELVVGIDRVGELAALVAALGLHEAGALGEVGGVRLVIGDVAEDLARLVVLSLGEEFLGAGELLLRPSGPRRRTRRASRGARSCVP